MTHEQSHRSFDSYFSSMLAGIEQTGDVQAAEIYRVMKPYISHAYRSGFADGGVTVSQAVAELFDGHPVVKVGSVRIAE
jgi:hypothetical protein